MARTVKKLTQRRRPGPHAAGGLPWAQNPSFFDKDVQKILLRRKEHLGWPITCWEVIEVVTRRYNPLREHGFFPPAKSDDDEKQQRLLHNRWAAFANCYNGDPDFVAPLFAAMTSFHAISPKEWPLSLKLAYLSTLAEYEGKPDTRRPALPLRNRRKAEILKKWFGNKITPEQISIELSRERKRRLGIHAEWKNHYEYLNQQKLEEIKTRRSTPTSTAKQL
jgi:hypothetical protein